MESYPSDWSDFVHTYSTDVLQTFRIEPPKPKSFCVGIELEYQFAARSIRRFNEIAYNLLQSLPTKYAILKEDCSITDDCDEYQGAELVTIPATVKKHLANFKQVYCDEITQTLVSTYNTGMHVHINRSSMSLLTIGKLMVFLNSPDHRWKIERIAGRDESEYAAFEDKVITDVLSSDCRYQAVNLNNDYTVEIRIFKSPINYLEFAGRLQFVDALVDFCQNTSIMCIDYANFKQFVSKNHYPHLKKYLLELCV